jgi:hypothetical protein
MVKPESISALRNSLMDLRARRVVEGRLKAFLNFFRNAAEDPRIFRKDPGYIDRVGTDLGEMLKHVPRSAWPSLFDMADEISRIAEATREIRMQAPLWKREISA